MASFNSLSALRRGATALALALISAGQAASSLARTAEDSGTVLHALTPTMATPPKSQKLQGRAEVAQPLEGWQASQAYRQGFAAMSANNFAAAASCFKVAGDGFEASGEGVHAGEARFAEAQACKLMRQDAKAAKIFGMAADLFKRYDPSNPFLKASLARMEEKKPPLQGKLTHRASPDVRLRSLPPQMDTVQRNIPLKGNVTELDDGTKVASLHDNDFFTGGQKRLLPEAAAADINEGFVKEQILKAFAQMNCLEFAALGGNTYTAPDNYTSLKSGGKPIVIGASEELWSPNIKLFLNRKQYGISMDLPGMNKYSHNVLVVTDGQHVLAIDPRTHDTWKLMAGVAKKKGPEFNWQKLGHVHNAAASQ
jgi:hypothetical protein